MSDYRKWMRVGDIVTAGGAMNGKCCLVTATYTDGTALVEDPFARRTERVGQEDLEFVDRPFCISYTGDRYMIDESATGMHSHIMDAHEDWEDADAYLVGMTRKLMLEGYENQ